MPLKAVIFDFGGVLARTRSQHLRQAWEQQFGLRPGEASELVFGGESGRAAQHGWISDAEHWAFIQRRLGLDDATLAQFRRDFFAEDGIDTDLLAYIDRLRRVSGWAAEQCHRPTCAGYSQQAASPAISTPLPSPGRRA